MKILAITLTVCFHWFSLAQVTNDVSVEEAIVGFSDVAARAGYALTGCNDGLGDPGPIKVNLEGDPNLYHKEVKLSGEWPNKSVEFQDDKVTILSEEEAQRLFQEFSRIEYEKFLLKNNITAAEFESDLSKYEMKKHLMDIYNYPFIGQVNDMYIHGRKIWMGTSEGLTSYRYK